jgi:hypothetical protein
MATDVLFLIASRPIPGRPGVPSPVENRSSGVKLTTYLNLLKIKVKLFL